MSQQHEEDDRGDLIRSRFGEGSASNREGAVQHGAEPTLVPVDDGGPIGPAADPFFQRMELEGEVANVGKFRFKGQNHMATQVMAVGSVVAGGVLWPIGGWLPGLMVMILGPTVAWVFRKSHTAT